MLIPRLTMIPGFVDFIGHHPNGMVAHVSHTNGTVYRVDADPSGMRRPSNIHLRVPGSSELSFGSHRYDGAGNLMVRGPEYFHYDRLSRVTRFQRGDGTNQTYGFDTFGNLGQVTTFDGLSSQTRTYAINRQKNRLSGVPYDARGNLLHWGGQDYRFDEVDMLVQKEFPWETYIYTAEDERILTLRYTPQNDKLREVYSLRDLGGTLLRTYRTVGGSKGAWSWGNDFIHDGSGKTLVKTSNKPAPLRDLHYAHDHLGTPVITTNQDGTIIGTDSLWAFGEPVDPNGSFTLKRFTGHERDYSPDGRTFDLDYMHARYYMPQMGRFLSVDPARRSQNPTVPQSWNRYSYGLNGPMKFVDPDGRSAEVATAVVLTGGAEFSALAALAAGAPVVVVGSASLVAGRFIGTREFGGRTIDDRVSSALADLILLFGRAKGGGSDSGFLGVSTDELRKRLETTTGKKKLRVLRELKNRGERNKQKRRGGKRQPKKGKAGDNKIEFTFEHSTSPDLDFLLFVESQLEFERSTLCGSGIQSCPI